MAMKAKQTSRQISLLAAFAAAGVEYAVSGAFGG